MKGVATRVGGITTNPSVCYSVTDGRYFASGTPIQSQFGVNWHDGQPMHVGFTTVLPPNAPACADGGSWADSYTALLPPASNHPGGVQPPARGRIGLVCQRDDRYRRSFRSARRAPAPSPDRARGAYGAPWDRRTVAKPLPSRRQMIGKPGSGMTRARFAFRDEKAMNFVTPRIKE